VIGTVKGDVHTVGKDMVTTMLTVAGFDVKDLGVDVDSATFITEAQAFGAKLIGLSALMSTTMPYQKEVIEFLEAKNLRQVQGDDRRGPLLPAMGRLHRR